MSAFKGIRVLDFSQGLAGPMATSLLGDFAAEVIKVEPPAGDRLKDDPGYLAWNRNKRRLVLDLAADPKGARALIDTADVVVFDHAPGQLERLGLDAETLLADRPGLIHVWMPPYGTTGRWSNLPADHLLLTALTGLAFRQGSWEDQPVCLVAPLAHYGQAISGAAAMGAALYERAKTGFGQAVVVSGLHGAGEVGGAATGPDRAQIVRLPRGTATSYRLYQCGDGKWIFLGTLFRHFFLRALDAMGLLADLLAQPSVGGDPANLLTPENAPNTAATLERRFTEKPSEEWLQILLAADVPCAPVGTREAWFASETVRFNAMHIALKHPTLGQVAIPGVSAKLSQTPGAVTSLMSDTSLEALPAHTPPAAPAGEAPVRPVLDGVKVLDLGAVIAGAFAANILAGFGADVIKIEPQEGESFRSGGLGFISYSRGKRGLGLDLKQPAGRDLFLELAREADVVIDNYRLGVRERLGIDYAALKAINPRIISCSVTAYGPEGPRASLPGFDPLLQAEGGLMAAQGGGGDPVMHAINVNDVGSAAMAAFGIIAALNARERTGEGQEVQTCLASQAMVLQSGEVVAYAGRTPAMLGARDFLGDRALRRFYACADGWIGLACSTVSEAEGLWRALSLPGWPDAATALAAPPDGALARSIADALATTARDDALAGLEREGAPAVPALTGAEHFDDPWLWENAFFETYAHPDIGEVIGFRAIADWSRGGVEAVRLTPRIGEHSREVLREHGFDEARIKGLLADKVVFET